MDVSKALEPYKALGHALTRRKLIRIALLAVISLGAGADVLRMNSNEDRTTRILAAFVTSATVFGGGMIVSGAMKGGEESRRTNSWRQRLNRGRRNLGL
jgi:hypothetical protein